MADGGEKGRIVAGSMQSKRTFKHARRSKATREH